MHVEKYANGPDENNLSDVARGDVTPRSRSYLLSITAKLHLYMKCNTSPPQGVAAWLHSWLPGCLSAHPPDLACAA